MGRSIRHFAFSILRLLVKYREAIADDQLKLNRIAEGAIALYTATAVLSKIDHELQHTSDAGPQLNRDIAIARFYCNYAFDKLDRSMDCLFADNRDKEIQSLADTLTEGRVQ